MNRNIVAGLIAALSITVLAVPCSAAETWECTITSLIPQNKGHVGSIRIQIDGDKLEWEVLADKTLLAPNAPPTWIPFFEYQVLADNDVGVVAAKPQASEEHVTGIHLGAWVLIILKPSGDLSVGSVEFTGKVSDDVVGKCKSI